MIWSEIEVARLDKKGQGGWCDSPDKKFEGLSKWGPRQSYEREGKDGRGLEE